MNFNDPISSNGTPDNTVPGTTSQFSLSDLADTLGTLGQTAASIINATNTGRAPKTVGQPLATNATATPINWSSYMPIILGGAGVLLLAIVFMFRKK